METGNLNHYKEFCLYRNRVKKLSKANRKEYEATLASEAKSNPKAVCKYINKRLNIQKEITEIHVNSEFTESRITEDNELILDTFSKYFASIFTKNDNNHLPTIDISPCKSEMNEFLVTERMVSEQIRKLDITKSAGPDNINARVLTLYDPGGGGGALKALPPLRFFALTHLILELQYGALGTFPKK